MTWLSDITDGVQRLVVGGVQTLSPWNLFSSTVRIGVTGLSRAGKTAFLTSAASLLLARTQPRFALAPLGAGDVPRFDQARHLAALAGDPPRWPERTDSVSMLALTAQVDQSPLPSRTVRLEFLDYPGEWLLDLPLLTLSYPAWSAAVLARLEAPSMAPFTREFLAFAHGLPAKAPPDESLARAGTELYRAMLVRLRDAGFSYLQPGRHLMPAPGPEPPWIFFFPARGQGPFASLLAKRYDAYVDSVRRSLASPLFAEVDRLVVLADVLSALHAGAAAFADTREALAAAAGALRWRFSWADALGSLLEWRMPPKVIGRVAFVATKSDHVAERQRGNLAALMRNLAQVPGDGVATAHFAAASVRCTEDFVWTLEGRPVSAVRGRVLGQHVLTRSYPGEVPDQPPDTSFWAHPFLALPQFEPMRLADGGRLGVPNIGMDAVLNFLLQDVL
jgi:predicted YcjX-like family ATPase